ncbi:molybdenum cofactor guanylyltransferase [Psychrobacter urativorans]|uniref:Molybdenum cofactor guanylyltransferase n=1 Tax=Psychrobacter urativorans TaxID=45610 RepID=A0A0M4TVY5_9GAMM|nr:NTP transferase domain-containing protein [Psychrobacter urativorans]ALF60211.1 molybdenum cofactor guanylyltransferase [Psychrobacter urativorans]
MTDSTDKSHGSHSLAGVVILAGGASKRMGSPKAALMLPTNETLLNYHVRQALMLNVPIMIADNARGFTVDSELLANNPKLPIFHIADYDSTVYDTTITTNPNDTGGALVAIESALQTLVNLNDSTPIKNKSESWLLVISCDSLIPASELWQKLQPFSAQATDKSVICLTDDAHLYPLLGLYQLSIEHELRAYIDCGERKVMRFIKPITQAVPVPQAWLPLTNLNTPEDFKRACTTLDK